MWESIIQPCIRLPLNHAYRTSLNLDTLRQVRSMARKESVEAEHIGSERDGRHQCGRKLVRHDDPGRQIKKQLQGKFSNIAGRAMNVFDLDFSYLMPSRQATSRMIRMFK